MSERSHDNPLNDFVFGDEYWQGSQPAPELDQLFHHSKMRPTTYPELAIKAVGYLGGEDGINLPAGAEFRPNDPDSRQWYEQPGTLAVFDWEKLTIYKPEAFAMLSKHTHNLIKPFDEVNRDIGQSARQFVLGKEESADIPILTLTYGGRFIWTAQECEHGIGIYRRSVSLGLIEEHKGYNIGRKFRASRKANGSWTGQATSPHLWDAQVPFTVAAAHEHPLSDQTRANGTVRSVERFKRVEVLETGAREKATQKSKLGLLPRLGKVSLGF